MRLFDNLLTRQRRLPQFAALTANARRRLGPVCRELTKAEQALAERLDLPQPPRLLLVDEEQAVIVTPDERAHTG